jgi:hypothetical protein
MGVAPHEGPRRLLGRERLVSCVASPKSSTDLNPNLFRIDSREPTAAKGR